MQLQLATISMRNTINRARNAKRGQFAYDLAKKLLFLWPVFIFGNCWCCMLNGWLDGVLVNLCPMLIVLLLAGVAGAARKAAFLLLVIFFEFFYLHLSRNERRTCTPMILSNLIISYLWVILHYYYFIIVSEAWCTSVCVYSRNAGKAIISVIIISFLFKIILHFGRK